MYNLCMASISEQICMSIGARYQQLFCSLVLEVSPAFVPPNAEG